MKSAVKSLPVRIISQGSLALAKFCQRRTDDLGAVWRTNNIIMEEVQSIRVCVRAVQTTCLIWTFAKETASLAVTAR